MKVTMLGCGSSTGVPVIGCECQVCTSTNPKNKRLRVSVLIETQGKNILIDTSPDLRQQALTNNIRRLDAILYTHDHADHTHGLDDLRSFNYLANKTLPVYGDTATLSVLKTRFAYAFQPQPDIWYRPSLLEYVLPDEPVHEFKACGVGITMFKQQHGRLKSAGYRIGNFAYSTDTDQLPDTAFEALEGVELWIVDCLRYEQSPSHSNLVNTLKWVNKVKPKQAILTHMAHTLDYDVLTKELPPGVVPGYDGMVLEL